ncbi:hypothetical protein GJAV_G00270650 [Gymnothorax javanicus]|nr:hypothetical protein GJAV_G00270650 [Gymnothorax javanicus]
MKKAKIWIRACVCILLYSTFAACSRGTGSQRIDNDDGISLLKQNIPRDYKIPVRFIPREMSGKCWVELNVFHLEESLKSLAEKFGNVSSNRNNITVFVQMLRDVRYRIGFKMESIMQDFECHYRIEECQTECFFDYVREVLSAASSIRDSEECDSPPCATTAPTELSTEGAVRTTSAKTDECFPASDYRATVDRQYLPEDAQKSLLSLLLVSVAANICLVVWMLRGRRRRSLERNTESRNIFVAVEASRCSSRLGQSEKDRLNTMSEISPAFADCQDSVPKLIPSLFCGEASAKERHPSGRERERDPVTAFSPFRPSRATGRLNRRWSRAGKWLEHAGPLALLPLTDFTAGAKE